MYKKSITCTDYNGEEYTEDYYFNLTKAELMEMHLSANGGLDEKLNAIIKAKDVPQIAKIFKEILLKAYGEKSEDGKRFIKSEEISKAFTETEAYSELYMNLITDENFAAEFIKGILPKDLNQEAK